MTEQQTFQWLLDNENLIVNSTQMDREFQQQFFAAYNMISPVKKTQTSCGRCIHNMRVYLQDQIKQIKVMTEYKVYRTTKGNLSFKEQGEVEYTIRCNSKLGAEEALALIKKSEKQNKAENNEQ